MKTEKLRVFIIAAILVIVAVTGIMGLQIEPAGPLADDTTNDVVAGQVADTDVDVDINADVDDPAGDVTNVDPADDANDDVNDNANMANPVEPDNTAGDATGSESSDKPVANPAVSDKPVDKPADNSGDKPADKPVEADKPADNANNDPGNNSDSKADNNSGDDAAATEPETPAKMKCTVEIVCDTLLDTSKVENEAILPYIPSDGVVLAETEVEFTEGESAFEVLKRVCRQKDIQMEFRADSAYSGYYIEGINYMYEFDGGALSGWMYKVNEKFPNYGCARYIMKDGDKMVWMYTCDLGRDIGDNSDWQ